MSDEKNIHVQVGDGANVSVIFDDEEVPYLLVSSMGGSPPRVKVHQGAGGWLDFGRILKVRQVPEVKRLYVQPLALERILMSREFRPASECEGTEPGQLGEFEGQKLFVALDGEE